MPKRSFASFSVVCAASVLLPTLALAGEASSSPPDEQDQAIAVAVKTRLAATRVDSFAALEVEAAKDGTVWLRGTTPTSEAAERAVDVARNVQGVMLVKSQIRVEAPR